ncbi:hypothetical protein ES708_13039 [subsurface metagenome]
MPREFSEDTERRRPPEIDETHEKHELDEISKTAEEIASEASEKLEEQEKIEEITEDAIKELEELDSNAERAEEIARESVEELEGMEEDLGYKIEEVREELHEDFVNDMKDKLEERSVKETSSESEEKAESGEAEETEVSSESHIEGRDGMVYVIKTGEVSESKAELEVEESVEPSKEETPEVQQTSEETQEVIEQEASTKVRNSIVRPENLESEETESEQVETPERKKEHTTSEEHSIDETTVDEPKREHEDKGVVKESQEIEESSSAESQEEISEVIEETMDTENEREEIATEHDEIIEDELAESLEIEDDLELPIEIPEEIIEHIEELVQELIDELESSEEEENVEPRIIVEAMTGKEHIDTFLEPRPYFQETEEESEQREQDRVKEKIDEMFTKLSEEEREKLKEDIRSKLKTEKDLDEWIKRNQSVKASPDYKEKYADAKKYIRGKRKGKVPRLIRELWKDEVERIWSSVVGAITRRSLERSLAKALKSKTISHQRQAKKTKRKTGYHKKREHTIRLHKPMCGKRPAGSFESYRKWLEQNYPGICERSDYPTLLEQLRKYFELRDALKKRVTIRQFELDDIADKIGLKQSTVRDWVFYGQVPHLFKIVTSSLSKKEGLRLRKVLLKKMGGISSWAELEDELKKTYSGGAYKRIPDYKGKEQRTKEFFSFLDELVKGGTKKGIARRSGISQRRVRGFFDGELPWLIRNVLSKSGRLTAPSRYRSHLSSIYKVKLRSLKVRKQEIVSYADFEKLIQREFPWLKERSDYERLMKTMRAYFDARLKFGNQKHVTRKEIVEFVKNYDVSYLTVSEWLVGHSLPMVVDMLDRSLSVSEARTELDKILTQLNGVVNLAEYKKRMRTCYIHNSLKVLRSYKKDYVRVKEFYRFLKVLEKGGLHTDIIGRGNLKLGNTVQRLLYNRFPRLIGIATSIPATPPERGCRWIPLKINTKGKPEKFIQVPLAINNVNDLLDVLSQLNPLKTRRMKVRIKRFGQIPRDIAFMYLLGALVSDGYFGRRDGTSTSASISLSTKYVWSETFGEAFCYCLGMFGFKAGRTKNSIAKNQAGEDIEKMNWKSSASPFLLWIRNTLLGLKLDKSKSNQPLSADWILKMPHELIVPFLQGVADGDGHASVRNLGAGIGTKHNKEFYKMLLDIFGIDTLDGGTGIVIVRNKALRVAAELPLFKYADGRLFRLHELNRMRESMKYTKVSSAEQEKILKYHKQGINASQIGPLLWVEFGKARRSNTIQKVINDAEE